MSHHFGKQHRVGHRGGRGQQGLGNDMGSSRGQCGHRQFSPAPDATHGAEHKRHCTHPLTQPTVDPVANRASARHCNQCGRQCDIADLQCQRGISRFADINTKDDSHA